MLFALLGIILRFDGASVDVEIADTPPLQAKGLMHLESLLDNQGMLFVYPKPQMLSFWMKNTKIPLSIGFFDSEKTLLQIEDMAPPEEGAKRLVSYNSKLPSQYALEVPSGWFKKNKISIGDKFTLQDSNK